MVLPMQGDWPHRAPFPETTPHISASSPTALDPLWEHLCLPCTHLFWASTSRTRPRVPALCCMLSGLRKGVLGVLCFQMLGGLELALQVGSGLSSLHTTPQSGHHARVSHSVNHPAFHPCVTIPRFHKHSFTLCRKTYQDILSLIFLRVPVSNDYLISFHFLLISGTWLYKN